LQEFTAGVMVIDNCSDDDTCEEVLRHSGVRLVRNASNLGFAAAVNQGFRLLDTADCILLLNPDVRLTAGLETLLSAAGLFPQQILAGLLTDGAGEPQRGFAVRRFPRGIDLCFENLGINRLWPSNPANRRFRALDLSLLMPQDVEQPAGAFLLIPRQAWESVSGMDERFWPAWFEDVDFLQRTRRAGFPARLIPSARAAHAGGHSFTTVSWSERHLAWYGNLLKYAAIHLGPWTRRAVAASVLAGSIPRAVTGCFRQRSLGPLHTLARVIFMAADDLAATRPSRSGGASSHAAKAARQWFGGS
jgi:GT2 family glycosyltransferase